MIGGGAVHHVGEQFAEQLLAQAAVGGIAPEVAGLMGVGFQIVEFAPAGGGVGDEFVARGDPDALIEGGIVGAVLHADAGAGLRGFAFPDGGLVAAFELGRDGNAGEGEPGGGKVDEALEGGGLAVLRQMARPTDDAGNAEGLLVGVKFFPPETVVAEKFAVVGGEDDEGVLQFAGGFESVEDAADMMVHEADHAVVAGGIFAGLLRSVGQMGGVGGGSGSAVTVAGGVGAAVFEDFPVDGRLVGETFRLAGFKAEFGQVVGIVHGGPGFGDHAGIVGILEIGGDVEGFAGAAGGIDGGQRGLGDPGGVVGFGGEIPGAVLIVGGVAEIAPGVDAPVLQPDTVVHAAGVGFGAVTDVDVGVLKAVPGAAPFAEVVEIVNMGGAFGAVGLMAGVDVAFADHVGVVALLPEDIGDQRGQRGTEGGEVVHGPMGGGIASAEEGGAAGETDGRGGIAAGVDRAEAGEAVQIGGADVGVEHPEGVGPLLIGDEKEDIGWHRGSLTDLAGNCHSKWTPVRWPRPW